MAVDTVKDIDCTTNKSWTYVIVDLHPLTVPSLQCEVTMVTGIKFIAMDATQAIHLAGADLSEYHLH